MKKLILILLFVSPTLLFAQANTNLSISESRSDEEFSLTVKVSKNLMDELTQVFLDEAGWEGELTGTFSSKLDNGAEITLDTKKRRLELVHRGDYEAHIKELEAQVSRIKERFRGEKK